MRVKIKIKIKTKIRMRIKQMGTSITRRVASDIESTTCFGTKRSSICATASGATATSTTLILFVATVIPVHTA